MLSSEDPDHLFKNITNSVDATVIVYSSIITKRLEYTCEFVFNTVLQVNFQLTNDLKIFEESLLCKINYSLIHLPGIVQIVPQSLLFEKEIFDKKPSPFFKDSMIYFYKTLDQLNKETFHFDIFSAVFYFISRYEEWQPYQADKHGRFEAAQSLLYKNNFHLKPVTDIWIRELADFLEKQYNKAIFPEKKFQVVSTIDVDNLFAYTHKGLLRTAGASLKDLLKGDIKNLKNRLAVISGRHKDPFDIYETISGFCADLGIPLIWFFLMRTGTAYDRSVDPVSKAFKNVFDLLKKRKATIGLHPSYDAAFESGRLENEKSLIDKKLGAPVKFSRQHFLRFNIKTTPALLLANGIHTDFSMGFASTPGFRAGASHPFFYFDFVTNQKQELLFVPFCTMDGAYFVYDKITPEAAFESMIGLAAEVQKTGGFFISVFHERTFSNHLYPGFGSLYKNLHQKLKEV